MAKFRSRRTAFGGCLWVGLLVFRLKAVEQPPLSAGKDAYCTMYALSMPMQGDHSAVG